MVTAWEIHLDGHLPLPLQQCLSLQTGQLSLYWWWDKQA